MSRAGRAHGPTAKKREVHARIREAAAAHAAGAEPVGEENPEVPPEVLAQWRAQQLFGRCKAEIVRRHPPLWPPEAVGMELAERWLQAAMRALHEQAVAAERERLAAAGLVIPA